MMHEFRRIRFAPVIATAFLSIIFLTLPALMPARAAMNIQEVKSDSGVTAWLVEDYSVPIIALRFAFRGGDTQDPAGKEGLVNLMTGLFDEWGGHPQHRCLPEPARRCRRRNALRGRPRRDLWLYAHARRGEGRSTEAATPRRPETTLRPA